MSPSHECSLKFKQWWKLHFLPAQKAERALFCLNSRKDEYERDAGIWHQAKRHSLGTGQIQAEIGMGNPVLSWASIHLAQQGSVISLFICTGETKEILFPTWAARGHWASSPNLDLTFTGSITAIWATSGLEQYFTIIRIKISPFSHSLHKTVSFLLFLPIVSVVCNITCWK